LAQSWTQERKRVGKEREKSLQQNGIECSRRRGLVSYFVIQTSKRKERIQERVQGFVGKGEKFHKRGKGWLTVSPILLEW